METPVAEWSERIQAAAERGVPLCIRGRSSLGLPEAEPEQTLTLSHWHGVVEYDPGELAITVRSGTRWQDLLAVLAEQGQIPAGAPLLSHPQRTVGGLLATGYNGPARPWLGDLRGAVLGVAMLNGRGQLLTFGGRVMKNVAGFDLSRLQTGAWGRFGPILEVSLRTRPAFQHCRFLQLEAPLEKLPEVAASMRQAPLTGLCWYQGRIHVRLQGLAAGVEQAARQVGGETEPHFWPAHETLQLPIYQHPVYRVVLPVTHIERLQPVLEAADDLLLDWGSRLLWLASQQPLPQLRQAVAALGGWLQAWPPQGPPLLPPARQQVLDRLQQAFDPHGVFRHNPWSEPRHADPPAG